MKAFVTGGPERSAVTPAPVLVGAGHKVRLRLDAGDGGTGALVEPPAINQKVIGKSSGTPIYRSRPRGVGGTIHLRPAEDSSPRQHSCRRIVTFTLGSSVIVMTDVRSDESGWLAQQFETHRAHLRDVAYRMLDR
jgi:hypothetical protein